MIVEEAYATIEDGEEDKPGVILDYNQNGNIVGLEIRKVSKRASNPPWVEYVVTRYASHLCD